ncbi:MAG: hypothetical protein EBV49_13935 [Betaproteobacteria bacterium]|nr:hypothetical protein [Betaproteobacteria bacterium]
MFSASRQTQPRACKKDAFLGLLHKRAEENSLKQPTATINDLSQHAVSQNRPTSTFGSKIPG